MLLTLQRPKTNIVYNRATFNIGSNENQKEVLLSINSCAYQSFMPQCQISVIVYNIQHIA